MPIILIMISISRKCSSLKIYLLVHRHLNIYLTNDRRNTTPTIINTWAAAVLPALIHVPKFIIMPAMLMTNNGSFISTSRQLAYR